jgi:ABC-type nitrate/sulfonate/bicarbonate transport system substrate-binding protein
MQKKSIFAAALAALLVAGVLKSATAQQPATMGPPPQLLQIKAGISDPVNTVLAWYMARAAGLYAAQGLNVEILNMNGGSRGAEELQAARLDVMHVGLSSVVKVNQAGGNLRVIGSLSNVIRFTFFSAPGVKTAFSAAASTGDTQISPGRGVESAPLKLMTTWPISPIFFHA